MKKSKKRLSIDKQTIRTLADTDITSVRGGVVNTEYQTCGGSIACVIKP